MIKEKHNEKKIIISEFQEEKGRDKIMDQRTRRN